MATYAELNGKVAVISGAGGNLGMAVVQRFHAENVKLALIDINADRLRDTLGKNGITDALVGGLDLTNKADVDQFIDKVVATYGQVDIVVNIAGGWKPGQPVHEMDESFWDSMLNLNVKTAYLLSAAAVRQMLTKGNQGRIVNIASRAALKGDANSSAYAAGKAAMLRLTESMSGELLKQGITVNAIMPSTIDTPQNRKDMPSADFSKWVSPSSIADVIAFLASDGARDISGAAIPVYGRA